MSKRSLLMGAVAGLAATYAMTQFQTAWSSVARKLSNDNEKDKLPRTEDPATVIFANKILAATTGGRVPDDKKELVGNLVHYGFGALAGAIYAVAAEAQPRTRSGFGTAYGTAVFLGADEIGVPAAGLSKGPLETPPKVHLYGWLSHLVYGSALEASYRAIDKVATNYDDSYEIFPDLAA